MPSNSDFNYLQKVNGKCPQISDEKKSFASWTNNFWSVKIRIKSNLSMEQNLLFSAGIACKIYLLMPSNFDEKNALWLWLILPSENDGI
jgi:hypothetical protein